MAISVVIAPDQKGIDRLLEKLGHMCSQNANRVTFCYWLFSRWLYRYDSDFTDKIPPAPFDQGGREDLEQNKSSAGPA